MQEMITAVLKPCIGHKMYSNTNAGHKTAGIIHKVVQGEGNLEDDSVYLSPLGSDGLALTYQTVDSASAIASPPTSNPPNASAPAQNTQNQGGGGNGKKGGGKKKKGKH